MKTIEVNNGRKVEIISTENGVAVHHRTPEGYIDRVETFSDGEIIMLLNLAEYMKSRGKKEFSFLTVKSSRYFDRLFSAYAAGPRPDGIHGKQARKHQKSFYGGIEL